MDNTREKQLGALGLCAFSLPAVLFLPQTGWPAAGIVTLGSMLVAVFGKTVVGERISLWEKWLAVPVFLWNVLIMGMVGWELSYIHGVDNPLPGLLLIILGGYAVKKGVVPVVGAVLAFFVPVIYGLVYVFAIPEGDFGKLTPQVRNIENMAYGFLPMLLLYMYKGSKRKKAAWAVAGLILAVGAAVVTAIMDAPDFYTGAKSVNLFGTMERWEPLVGVGMTLGGFCFMAMLFAVNESIWKKLWNQKKKFPVEILLGVCAGVILTGRNGADQFWSLGTTVCWGLFPILTQLVVSEKKIKKYQKN